MTMETLSAEARAAALQRGIADKVRDGYRVISQSPTNAQLVKPKAWSWGFFLAWTVLSLGTLFWLYPLWHLIVNRPKSVYLEVRPEGTIVETRG